MKNNRLLAILMVVVILTTMLVACSKNKESKYTEEEVTVTEIVTDESGEAVTDEDGEIETVVVEVQNSNDGNSADAVVDYNYYGSSDSKDNTSNSGSNNDNSGNSSSGNNSSSNNGNKNESNTENGVSTTSPIATTEKPEPIGPEEKPTKKNDVEMTVVMPFLTAYDQDQYKLIVKVGKKELTYDVVGCRGQSVVIVIPKTYNGDDATLMLDMKGKRYNVDFNIQKNVKIALQTMVIVDGDDD